MFTCSICNLSYVNTYENKCIFCNIINKNKKQDIMNIIICQSKLSQQDIIQKTYEYFHKNDKIPKPIEIDSDIKIIEVNPYIFREFVDKEFINSKLNNNILNQKYKILNQKYKIFFTNCIDLNKIKTKRFPLKYNMQKLNVYLDNQINLKDLDIDVFNSYNKFRDEYYLKHE